MPGWVKFIWLHLFHKNYWAKPSHPTKIMEDKNRFLFEAVFCLFVCLFLFCFFNWSIIFCIYIYIYTIFKSYFPSAIIPKNIGYIPCVVQYILKSILHPMVCASHIPTPALPSTSTGNSSFVHYICGSKLLNFEVVYYSEIHNQNNIHICVSQNREIKDWQYHYMCVHTYTNFGLMFLLRFTLSLLLTT